MKKIIVMFLLVLLVAFLANSFTNTKKVIDKDVGYSLTIDQITAVSYEVSASVCEIQIARGVSVPDKGLSNSAISINFKSQISPMCRIDNYSQSWQRSISTNLVLPVKGINLLACDLGNRQRFSKINIV